MGRFRIFYDSLASFVLGCVIGACVFLGALSLHLGVAQANTQAQVPTMQLPSLQDRMDYLQGRLERE